MGISTYNRGSRVIHREADAATEAANRRMGRPVRKATCSCGCGDDHIVARRGTADETRLLLWSDGTVTDRARIIYGTLPIASMWAAVDLFGLFDASEIRGVIRDWKRAMKRVRSTPETARTHVLSPPKPKAPKVARPGVVIGGYYYSDRGPGMRPRYVRWL